MLVPDAQIDGATTIGGRDDHPDGSARPFLVDTPVGSASGGVVSADRDAGPEAIPDGG